MILILQSASSLYTNYKTGTMKSKFLIALVGLQSLALSVFAQIRETPKAVEETFTNQYKGATNIDYKDQLVRVDVSFELEGEKMLASYTNKGVWKETQKEYTYDKLPDAIKDGFTKSRYADREIEETTVIYLPGGGEQYRLKAKKNGVEKKYLYFNKDGRLLRTSVTI
jgi:hypothetical protein